MKSDQYMQQVFAEFWASLKQNAGNNRSELLKHSDYNLPNRTRYFQCMVFISMAGDSTRALIGETNRFLLNIVHADSWFQAAQKHEEDEKMDLLWEFADPQLELSVSRPYSLRNHFIFTAVHLLHQSNRLKMPNWKDELPPDDKINYKHLDVFGKNWPCFKTFKEKIELLNDKSFQDATRNYRHRLQHRFRTHFDFGLTPYIERTKTDIGITYSFNVLPPLNLQTLIPELYKQHKIATEVFQAYWQLVSELCVEWDKKYAKT
jgi:hypothetical protein